MDTVMSEEKLQDVFDQVTREVTEKIAGIRLCEGDAPLEEDSCTVHAAFERGFHSSLALCADTAMFTRLTQSMLQEEEVTEQDVEDFTKEYFNVLCGHIASRLFQVTKVASRFEIPEFYTGRYQPEDQKEQFAICYSSDKNEGARLSHFTSESE
ncbi:MAG: chemotaxis protein CheX [Ruminococcus sp.]|nr:chemotaxis protein CheX [Ruminococcus sp.]